MAPKGRKRAAEALKVEIDASYMMMARASGESRYKASRDFNEVADRETPYGRILKYMDLQGDDDSYFTLAYACPFALFYCLCSLLLTFWGLVTASLVFYMDETRPGNLLRPDMARSMHGGIFWGIADLPDWYRDKNIFWIPFAQVPSKEMCRIRGGASAVFLKVLEVFWPIPIHLHDFERTGVKTRGRILKFKYGFMIVDEKCEKEVSGVKGAAWGQVLLQLLHLRQDAAADRGRQRVGRVLRSRHEQLRKEHPRDALGCLGSPRRTEGCAQ